MGKKEFYFENLDGLRAFAALAVVLTHAAGWLPRPEGRFYDGIAAVISCNWDGGRLGVKFFFILSGYLITFLLLREYEEQGRIHLRLFYYRRFFRIWPLYYLSLFIGFVVYPLLRADPGPFHETASATMYLIFLTNFDNMVNYRTCGILGVQWSVAIEEQFYLFWPLLMILSLRFRRQFAAGCFVGLIILSDLYYLQANDLAKYYHLVSCVRFLAFGGLLGYLCFYRIHSVEAFFKQFNKVATAAVYVVSLGLLYSVNLPGLEMPYLKYLVHPLQFVFFGFVILEQNYSSASFFKMKSSRWLTYLGKISYGIYLLHMVAIYMVLGTPMLVAESLFLPNVVVVILVTILLSHLSFVYFERPFLKLKARYAVPS